MQRFFYWGTHRIVKQMITEQSLSIMTEHPFPKGKPNTQHYSLAYHVFLSCQLKYRKKRIIDRFYPCLVYWLMCIHTVICIATRIHIITFNGSYKTTNLPPCITYVTLGITTCSVYLPSQTPCMQSCILRSPTRNLSLHFFSKCRDTSTEAHTE